MPDTPDTQPPKLTRSQTGEIDTASVADLLEWFLNYDERTARIRHADTQELFLWKQADDAANGVGTYPFENAEARFAVGAVQAVKENNTEEKLHAWLSDVLTALHDARETKTELTDSYNLNSDPDLSTVKRAEKLTSNLERRLFLTACWNEVLYTAEARFLGWVFQELYGRPFSP